MPELLACSTGPTDVVVRYGIVERLPTEDDEPGTYALEEQGDLIRLWMNGVGGLEVHRGSEVIIQPEAGAEQRGFRFLVSGIGMGFVLHQRAIPSLHASAVALDGEAVAFVGFKGMGKSTLAAALHTAGFPVVTDDVLPIYLQDGSAFVAPAFPHLKLWPQSVEAVFREDPALHPFVDPEGTKRTRAVEQGFSIEMLPLRCVYVLDWMEDASGPAACVEALSGADACVELLRHSFALRMFGEQAATPAQLRETVFLTEHFPVRRLRRARALDRIGEVVAAIRHDLDVMRRSEDRRPASMVA